MIATAVCTSLVTRALQQLLGAEWRVALIRAGAKGIYGSATAGYADLGNDEVQGAGYRRGGAPLANARLELRDGRVCLNFDAVRWNDCDIVTEGALIYAANLDGMAGAVLDFGGTYAATGGHPFYLPMDCPIRL